MNERQQDQAWVERDRAEKLEAARKNSPAVEPYGGSQCWRGEITLDKAVSRVESIAYDEASNCLVVTTYAGEVVARAQPFVVPRG